MGAKAPAKKKRDAKALIAGAALPERSVEVCLRPDLLARLQELERELQRAEDERKAGGGSLASGSASRVTAGQIDAIRAEMLEATMVFQLRALPRRKFRALQAEFPPRDGNAIDNLNGVNIEDAAEAMVRRCLIDPELDDADWAALDELLSDGQFNQLAAAAWAINSKDVEVPFSRTASRITQTSDDE